MKRLFGRLSVGILTMMLATAALPFGDRGAHAADSILTDVLRRGTVRIAISIATRRPGSKMRTAAFKATTSTLRITWRSSSASPSSSSGPTPPVVWPCCSPKKPTLRSQALRLTSSG